MSIKWIIILSVDRYMVITRPFWYAQLKVQQYLKVSLAVRWSLAGLILVFVIILAWVQQQHGFFCALNVTADTFSCSHALAIASYLRIPVLLFCTLLH